jgi:hypothetical protein
VKSLFHLFKIRYNCFNLQLPWRTYITFFGVWFLLLIINLLCRKVFHFNIDTPSYFPFSLFYFHFSFAGVIFFLLFLFCTHIIYQSKFYLKSVFTLWLSGLIFILIANIIQGNLYLTFIEPIVSEKVSYFFDAVNIDNWKIFISNFNGIQASLHTHSMTHPPGAVLLYYFCMLNKSPISVSIIFTLISSLSAIIIFYIFKDLGSDNKKASFFALLYTVIPAFNIYVLTSFDAVVLVFMNLFCLGLIKIIQSEKLHSMGLVFMLIGFLITSTLTFAVVFLTGLLFILSIYFMLKRKFNLLIASLLIISLSFLFCYLQYYFFKFNYLESFVLATKLENPHGFLLFDNPAQYIMSRIEDILEMLIFFSLTILATIWNKKLFQNINKNIRILVLTAVVVLLLEFLTGAYRTGETARACLFIVVYPFMLLKNLDEGYHSQLFFLTALQTGLMQLFGFYYW